MKKPDPWRLELLRRRARRLARRLRRRAAHRPLDLGGPRATIIRISGSLDLISDPQEARAQLSRLYQFRGQPQRRAAFVDISDVTKIDACGLSYLWAGIRCVCEAFRFVQGNVPKAELPAKLLRGAIDWAMARRKESSNDFIRKTAHVAIMRVEHNTAPSSNEPIVRMADLIKEDGDLDDVARSKCYSAFHELAENVLEHAFGDEPGVLRAWYATVIRQADKVPACAVITDIGVGIPGSLKKKFTDLFGTDDADLIEEAADGKRTRTGNDERGIGLRTLRESIVGSRLAKVHILSGEAMVSWSGVGACKKVTGLPALSGTAVCLAFSKGDDDG